MATNRERQIVAMGGGGFSMEPDNSLLDDFVLGLTDRAQPRICFLPTAGGDSADYIQRFHAAFPVRRAVASHQQLFKRDPVDIRNHLLNQHVIYVGGGNTANMLWIWRLHGVDAILREAWENGIVLCGVSAGMICWFEASVTDSYGPLAALNDGMRLLRGSACPHYDGEPERRPTYHRLIRARVIPPGVAADDGAAIHYVGTEIKEAVSSRPQAKAYRVELVGSRVVETPMPTRFLGNRSVSRSRSESRRRHRGRT
jgi:peptidase E